LGDDKNASKRVLVAIKKLKPEVDKNIKEDFFKEVVGNMQLSLKTAT